ncbi:hypothetical protein NDU88_001824 [Pleurodeles waltl]|uniref:Uncharacterized protein n=1 Tax=Pleurodeles waltl TaxID=8319 RepID=A0AAV7UTV0_PLEWA|nr:hypothetical protein NDU88_001824 [Pleurodeles waltl]
MDCTKIGLQRALKALNTFNKANQLQVNQEKTKVLIFGRYKNKKLTTWQLGSQTISTARKYNYLGEWFTENNTAGAQKNAIRHKAAVITYGLAKLNNQLRSTSAAPILRVTKTTLLPALQYGYLAFPGSLESTIEQAHCRAYLKDFTATKVYTSHQAQIENGPKVTADRLSSCNLEILYQSQEGQLAHVKTSPENDFQDSWKPVAHATKFVEGLRPKICWQATPIDEVLQYAKYYSDEIELKQKKLKEKAMVMQIKAAQTGGQGHFPQQLPQQGET